MTKYIKTVSTNTSTNTIPNIIDTYTTGTSVPYTMVPNTGITSPYWVDNIGNISITSSDLTTAPLHVKGDAVFEGDLKLQGKSIGKSLEMIEEKLAILHPNEKLEDKWDELRDLRNKYIQLEKEILEKEKVWDILNK